MTKKTAYTRLRERARILDKANDEALEICLQGCGYFIERLRHLPPHVACDAEEIAGKMQKYLIEYGS